MNENIKAGSDIHAGDGGYSLSTQAKYDEFVKGRNHSTGKARIKLLAEQASHQSPDGYPVTIPYSKDFAEKFAVLIIKKCRDIVSDTRDQAIEDGWNIDEAMSTAMFDIEEHFGVK